MGRRHDDDRTRQNRTRQYPGGYDQRGDQRRGPPDRSFYGPYYDARGNRFHEDQDGTRFYDDDYLEPYYERDRDREREGYWRDREQRQETRRTGMMVLGAIAVAVIALIGVMAVTGGEDSSQTGQQAPQQPAPQQPAQPQQPEAPSPQAPQGVPQGGASSEQVEGMRADLERQLVEIRQSINQLRLEIWSFFTSQQNQQEQEGSP